MYHNQHSLTAQPPFDFRHTLNFLGIFAPAKGEQNIADAILTKAMRLNGQTIVFRIQSIVQMDAPQLTCDLYADSPLESADEAAALQRIRFYLSLDDDLAPFYALADDDPYFAPLVQTLYGYHQLKFLTPFENALWAILSARNRHPIAHNLKQAITAAYGGRLTVDGVTYAAFPEATDLLALSAQDWMLIVKQEQRARYCRAVVEAFADVDDDWLYTAPTPDLENWLRGIAGIGAWSASFVLIRGLGRMGNVAVPEEALIQAVAQRYQCAASPDEVKRLAAHYGAHQGYWAHYAHVGSNA
jgi:DNA-3-methyladenine glycosylase II